MDNIWDQSKGSNVRNWDHYDVLVGSDGMVVTVMIHKMLEAKSDFYILEGLNTGIIKSGGGKTRTHEFLIVFGIHHLVKWEEIVVQGNM